MPDLYIHRDIYAGKCFQMYLLCTSYLFMYTVLLRGHFRKGLGIIKREINRSFFQQNFKMEVMIRN